MHKIMRESEVKVGGESMKLQMCLKCTSGGKTFGRRKKKIKQSAPLLSSSLPFFHRTKYFHGKKVNGEIEIRVEQVGWSWVFHAITLIFSTAGATLVLILCGYCELRLPENLGLCLGVLLNSRII